MSTKVKCNVCLGSGSLANEGPRLVCSTCHGTGEITFEGSGIKDHSGNKYIRTISSCVEPGGGCQVDVYEVLKAFDVSCPATQHALKKLLCAGIRGKGNKSQDLKEARDAISRAIEMAGEE